MKTDAHWKRVGFKSHQGILVFLPALRSQNSAGIGEFLDLLPMIDWCASIGLDVLQILPINDTDGDPSPYNAISSCALDPIYLSLAALGPVDPVFTTLAHLPRTDHNEVKREKMKWLKKYYEKHPRKEETEQFIQRHPWVSSYAKFKVYKEGAEEAFYCFLQLLCFEQMGKVKAHATAKNVLLKGDIPILISPESADVWNEPELFDRSLAAGAPPDYYNPKGQLWGFPLYRWPAMRQTHFAWWKERLRVAEELFDLYRIDHVVGFFRIWGILKGKKPADGAFFPADPSLWPAQGREILEMMIDASHMLPLAEDLGTIPNFVRPLLKELGICKTCVVRWQRDWTGDRSYIPFDQYEPFSLTTLSTHDSEPLPLWWKKFPDEAIPFAKFKGWSYQPTLTYDQHLTILREVHHSSSYFNINLLQETLLLFPELSWPNVE